MSSAGDLLYKLHGFIALPSGERDKYEDKQIFYFAFKDNKLRA